MWGFEVPSWTGKDKPMNTRNSDGKKRGVRGILRTTIRMKRSTGVVAGLLVLATALYLGYHLQPPRDTRPRTEAIDPATTFIDNTFYDDEKFSSEWWNQQGWAGALHTMNPVRVDYFARAFEKVHSDTPREQRRYLDIGCGGGLTTEGLARLGFNMVGIDISARSIAIAKQHAKDHKVENVEYMIGSALALPFRDNSFDGVVMSDVLEHLHDLPSFVKELQRVLKPGGVFAFDTINRSWKSYIVTIILLQSSYVGLVPKHAHDYRLYTTPDEMRQLLQAGGIACQEFVGLEAEFSFWAMLRTCSVTSFITAFRKSPDMSLSYLGYAIKEQ